MFTHILACLCDAFDDLKNMYLIIDEDCKIDPSLLTS